MPSFEIDFFGQFAGLEVLSIMLWPNDKTARDAFLVTEASKTLGGIEEDLPAKEQEILLQIATEASLETGRSLGELLPEIIAHFGGARFSEMLANISTQVGEKLFRPAGGWKGVSKAPGSAEIQRHAEASGRKFGAACGEILAYIVALDTHHKDIKPSMNKAMEIMVRQANSEHRSLPGERDRKTMWTLWGSVAPIWAAASFYETARPPGGHWSIYETHHLGTIISWSKWLTNFAIEFKAGGAKSPLLLKEKAIHLNCPIMASRPAIPRLSDKQLAWARAYRAPIPPP